MSVARFTARRGRSDRQPAQPGGVPGNQEAAAAVGPTHGLNTGVIASFGRPRGRVLDRAGARVPGPGGAQEDAAPRFRAAPRCHGGRRAGGAGRLSGVVPEIAGTYRNSPL